MKANDNAPIPPADARLSPEAVAACDWACTIPGDVSLVTHPEFEKHFGHLSNEQVTLASAEMRRRGEAAEREATLLLEEGRDRFGAGFMAGE